MPKRLGEIEGGSPSAPIALYFEIAAILATAQIAFKHHRDAYFTSLAFLTYAYILIV
jgi:hypothetical protein